MEKLNRYERLRGENPLGVFVEEAFGKEGRPVDESVKTDIKDVLKATFTQCQPSRSAQEVPQSA